MKKYWYILTCLTFFGIKAQDGKIGIATDNPTEQLDINNKTNGGLRVRTLPEQGDVLINTMPDGSYTKTKQTYEPTGFIVADANGVLGAMPSKKENNNDISANLLYEIKYKNVQDWMTAQSRNYLPFRVDEWEPLIFVNKMSTAKTFTNGEYDGASFGSHWFSQNSGNISITLKSTADPVWVIRPAESPTRRRINGSKHRQQLDEKTCIIDGQVATEEQCIAKYGEVPAYWAIWGDIAGLNDSWDITIIFVNKEFIATDAKGTIN